MTPRTCRPSPTRSLACSTTTPGGPRWGSGRASACSMNSPMTCSRSVSATHCRSSTTEPPMTEPHDDHEHEHDQGHDPLPADEPRAPAVTPAADTHAGDVIIAANLIGTFAFAVTAITAAVVFSTASQWVGAITAMALFAI